MEWLLRLLLCCLEYFSAISTVSIQDQGSAEPGDGLEGLTGWLYLCRLLLNQLYMHRQSTLVRCLPAMDALLKILDFQDAKV